MVTLIRKEEKKKLLRYDYTFYVEEMPQLLGRTNYRGTTEKYEWSVTDGTHTWAWKQANRNYRILDYIPVVNIVKAFSLELKYGLYKDGEKLGEAGFYGVAANKNERDFFIVNGRKYFCCQGNTDVIRPLKIYKWAIEDSAHQVVAKIEKAAKASVYKIEILGVALEFEWILLPVMHMDMAVFSCEGSGPVTAG